MADEIKPNEFNAELKRKNSMDSTFERRANDIPRTSSFKNKDKYVRTKSGTFVRMDSDSFETPGQVKDQLSPWDFRSNSKSKQISGASDFTSFFLP